MAGPFVAAAASLTRQYFGEGWYPSGLANPADAHVPSGALLKAVLINAATDMSGLAGYPGTREGFGRLRLDDALYFAGDARRLAVLLDARNALGLTSGISEAFEFDVMDPAEPLELTLAYTEPPAALLAISATVNDLDLEVVSPGGTTYLGNVFDTGAGQSVPGGAADPRNNVEALRIPDPQVGRWRARVRGAAVNQGAQGYALVATGGIGSVHGGSLRYASHLVDDSGPRANGNGVADPGETVTLPVELLNLRPAAASQVVALLISGDLDASGVTVGSAAFPDVPVGGTAGSAAPHFELTVSAGAACGELLQFRLLSADASGGSESSFGLAIGTPGDPSSCEPFLCGAEGVPGEVGPAMTAGKDGEGNLLLQWPGVAGAAAYRLWRAADAPFATAELAVETSDTEWLDDAATGAPVLSFYRVRAANSCGQEGP
jgi:hypothetical protein